MKVNVDFAQHIDVIEFEPFLGNDMRKYEEEFYKWFYKIVPSKSNPSIFVERSENYECFDLEPIIDWINEVSPDSHVKIISRFLMRYQMDETLPCMCF